MWIITISQESYLIYMWARGRAKKRLLRRRDGAGRLAGAPQTSDGSSRAREKSSVSRERKGAHEIAVTLERDQFLLIGRIPERDGAVLASGDEPAAIRGKCDRPDPSLMALEHAEHGPGTPVPQPDRSIEASSRHDVSAGGK